MKIQHLITLLAGLALSLGLFLMLPPGRVHAAGPITVNTAADTDAADSDCSLREAIVAANSDTAYNGCSAGSGTDGITFAGNYTITLTSALPAITSSVTITGNGVANTIVQASDCNPVTLPGGCTPAGWRVFTVMTTTATLKDLTARYGNCEGGCSLPGSNGGNIYAKSSDLTLDAVYVQSGYAGSDGGGIGITGGNLTVNDSLMGGLGTGNKSDSDGGGIHFRTAGDLTIDNSEVSYNQSASGYTGGIYAEGNNAITIRNGSLIDHNTAVDIGGGIYAHNCTEQLTIDASTISNNYQNGWYGGGLWTSCTTTINDSTISGNTADGYNGGGIYIHSAGVVTLTNSTVDTNSSYLGGGIYIDGALIATNNTFYGNTAPYGEGGAIVNATGKTATLINNTFSDNTADVGDSIYNYGTLHISNNIMASDFAVQNNCLNNGGSIPTDTNNLIQDNGTGGLKCGSSVFTGDMKLGPLQDNGGSTPTMALLSGSPAIDAGDNATCTATDQRGVTRPQNSICDIGAFESQGFTLSLTGGNNQSAQINTALTQALQVTLVSSDTNAGVPGEVITFTAPSSGASLSQTTLTATTNISGVASLTPTVNGLTGSYVVTASNPAVNEAITFTLQNYALYTLTTASGGNGGGSVTAGGVYTNGETVTITATANVGNYFTGWTGNTSGSTNPLAVTMDSDKAITATFNLDSTPPPRPALLGPADGSVISTTLRPTFSWAAATDGETSVVSYTLVITGSSGVQTIPTTGTTCTPATDLTTGVYTWTVQAHDEAGNVSGYASPPFTFTIETAGTEVYLPIVLKNN